MGQLRNLNQDQNFENLLGNITFTKWYKMVSKEAFRRKDCKSLLFVYFVSGTTLSYIVVREG